MKLRHEGILRRVLDGAAIHQQKISLLWRVNNVVAVLCKLPNHELTIGNVVRTPEGLDIDAFRTRNNISLLHWKIDFISFTLLAYLRLLLLGFLELALFDWPSSFLELEQFICDVLNITALPSTAHEYSFIHEGNAASQPSFQKHLPEEVESNNLVFPGDV